MKTVTSLRFYLFVLKTEIMGKENLLKKIKRYCLERLIRLNNPDIHVADISLESYLHETLEEIFEWKHAAILFLNMATFGK